MEIFITICGIIGLIAYIAAAVFLLLADPLWCVAIGAFMLSATVTFGILLGQLVCQEKQECEEAPAKQSQLQRLLLQTAKAMLPKRHG